MRRFGLLALVATLSCAHAPTPSPPPTFRCPAVGGPVWSELVSPHFRLRTNLPADQARATLHDFEKRFAPTAARVSAFVPGDALPADTDVIVFARDEEFRALISWAQGVFMTTDDRGMPVILLPASSLASDGFQHELVHRIEHCRLAGAPMWFSEGLAWFATGGRRVTVDDSKAALSVAEIVRGSITRYNSFGFELSSWIVFDGLARGTAAQQEGLRAFVRDLAAHRDPIAAFVDRIGNPATLEPAYRAQLKSLMAASATPSPPSVAAPLADVDVEIRVRALDETELHYLWATMSSRRTEVELENMRAHAGDSALLHWLRARMVEAHQDYVAADDELDRAVALAPAEPRWRFERTAMRANRILRGRVPGAKLGPLEGELAVVARQSDEPRLLNTVAWLYGILRRPNLGLPPARRAVAARPENGDYLDTLALLYFQNQQPVDAVRTQEEAIARLSQRGRLSAAVLDRLAMYRDAAHLPAASASF